MLFAGLSGFARGCLAIFLGAACAGSAPEFLPILLRHVDVVMFGRLFDIGKSELAVLIRHVNGLIEARYRVPYVAHVGKRFLALLREGEHAIGQTAPLGKVSMLLMRFP